MGKKVESTETDDVLKDESTGTNAVPSYLPVDGPDMAHSVETTATARIGEGSCKGNRACVGAARGKMGMMPVPILLLVCMSRMLTLTRGPVMEIPFVQSRIV
jgi:hypothetical protein